MKDDKLKSYLKEQMGEYTHPVDEELWSSIIKDVPVKKRPIFTLWRVVAMSAAAVLLLALVLFWPDGVFNEQKQQMFSENRFNVLPDSSATEQPGSLIAQSVQEIEVDDLAMIEESRKTVGIKDKNENKEMKEPEGRVEDGLVAVEGGEVELEIKEKEEKSEKAKEVNNEVVEKEEKRSVERKQEDEKRERQAEKEESKENVYDEKRKRELDNMSIGLSERDFDFVQEEERGSRVKRGLSMRFGKLQTAGVHVGYNDDISRLENEIMGDNHMPSLPDNPGGPGSENNPGENINPGGNNNPGGSEDKPPHPGLDDVLNKDDIPVINNDIYKRMNNNPKHMQPLSFAFTLRKELESYFSVESGLSYTYLRTEYEKNGYLRMHYLGIPVKALVSIYRNEKRTISFYGALQAMVEFNIAGKFKDKFGVSSITTSKPQYSYGVSVGFEVFIGKPVWFFVEPGYMHYPDDGSKIPSIRKDNPDNLSLQLGLRFNLD